MDEPFEIIDPENARNFLSGFMQRERKKGQSLADRGSVVALTPEKPGTLYFAMVRDGAKTFRVSLLYSDESGGWEGFCECEAVVDCIHAYAAMQALLMEHSAAMVRNLSANKVARETRAVKGRPPAQPEPGIAGRLKQTLGRALNQQEARYARIVSACFERTRQRGYLTVWDFSELGFNFGDYSWNSLKLWPTLPKDEYEFWLYVAWTARQKRFRIPPFMEEITDFSMVEERIKKWERQKRLDEWSRALENFQPAPIEAASELDNGETELRLLFLADSAQLQWRRPQQAEFGPVKDSHIARINDEEHSGWLRFNPASALLWSLLMPRMAYARTANFSYHDQAAMDVLGRILRAPLLEKMVLSADGNILDRREDTLQWALGPAESEAADYSFRLALSDGSPAPPILLVSPGRPWLYVTARGIFPGPPSTELLDPKAETLVPAPAIESATGVNFLNSLGVPLPERIAAKVQNVPLKIQIECNLQPAYIGAKSEVCAFRVRAVAEDGHEESWNGSDWQAITAKPRKRRRANSSIVVYDRRLTSMVPALMSPLGLKRDTWQNSLTVRVTRNFPELFSSWMKALPSGVHVEMAGELASLAAAEVSGTVKLDVTEAEIDWFDLKVVLDVTDTTLTKEEVALLLKARGGFVRLTGKGWRRLRFDLSEEEDERLARLGLSPRELSDEPQRLHALQLADDAAKKFLPEQQVEQIQRRAAELKARVAPAVPSSISAELRPYQVEGFHFLAYLSSNHFGGVLADDMGLGKTLQTLAWLVWLREEAANSSGGKAAGPSLVVCPKSVMDNWHAEAQRFASRLNVKVWPAAEIGNLGARLGDFDLHVINYNQLRLASETLASTAWLAVVLDEGQYIKNPSSQTAQVARSLRAGHRLVLSGTPIENRLMDLWSLMAFAMPGVLGSRAQFGKLYDAKGDPFARKRLSSRVRPFLLRRTKSQVAKDLPDRIEEDLFCEIEDGQKALYRAELKHAQQMLLRIKTQKELAQQQFHFLTSLLRLRQICCHPGLIDPDSRETGAKLEALLELLEPLIEEGQKILVFSQFVELLQRVKPALQARGWPFFYLAGETENRGELVREFQSAPGAAVFLISLKAGGFGLNLTAASYVVLFDPWWNPAVENQAIDRTHRIGQTNKVIAYRLLIKNSIEEKIRELQKLKKALAQDVLGEERFAQSLTLQDLQFLLSD